MADMTPPKKEGFQVVPESQAATDSVKAESNSLRWSMVFNVIMGIAGVVVAILSNSEALMVDGLYSLVNFCAAIIALRVSRVILKAPDHQRPFGYDADEALYVLFRALVLLGILSFAGFSSAASIIEYFRGAETPQLILGPIIIYSIAMVVLCGGLASIHHWNYIRGGRISEILATERTASIVDGFLSAGTGIALVVISLLKDTSVGVIAPIADSLVVLVLVLVIIKQPYDLLMKSMAEVAGKASHPNSIAQVKKVLSVLCDASPFDLLDVSVTQLGRTYTVVAFVRPDSMVDVDRLDQFRDQMSDAIAPLFGRVRSEVLYTARPITHQEPTP